MQLDDIRYMQSGDVEVVTELVREIDPGATRSNIASYLLSTAIAYVYVVDTNILGVIAARERPGPRLHISYLIVDPSIRGAGVGGRLLNKLREHFHRFHIVDLNVHEKSKCWEKLIGFYRQHGFERCSDKGIKHRMWLRVINP